MLNNIEDKEGKNDVLTVNATQFFDEMDDETLKVLIYTNKMQDLCNALSVELHKSNAIIENEC
tara:strand:+ start:1442 stop:1630 length:189 start_codon:yes stop_codon:yes gene_type:complete